MGAAVSSPTEDVKAYWSEQSANRREKSETIVGVRSGLTESGKSLLRGVYGLADIVTVPANGYKEDKWKGLAVGVGKGVVQGVGKPVSHIGSACIDVGHGVKAHIQRRGSRSNPGEERPAGNAALPIPTPSAPPLASVSATASTAASTSTSTSTGNWLKDKAAGLRSKTGELGSALSKRESQSTSSRSQPKKTGTNDWEFNQMRS